MERRWPQDRRDAAVRGRRLADFPVQQEMVVSLEWALENEYSVKFSSEDLDKYTSLRQIFERIEGGG